MCKSVSENRVYPYMFRPVCGHIGQPRATDIAHRSDRATATRDISKMILGLFGVGGGGIGHRDASTISPNPLSGLEGLQGL